MKQFSILDMKGNAIINCPSIPKIVFGDVSIQDAEPYCIYIVGNTMKYTIRNLQWLYLHHDSQAIQVKFTPFEFDGVTSTFTLPLEVLGKSMEIYINGLRQNQDIDFVLDESDIFHPTITFDSVYDSFDQLRMTYYKSMTVKEIELVDNLLSFKFFETYYEKFPGRTITSSDPEFDTEILYSPVGFLSSSPDPTDKLGFNQYQFDGEPRIIQIGIDSIIKAPLWYVDSDSVLYILSPLLSILSADPTLSDITYDDDMFKIINKESTRERLHLHSAVTLNDQPGYTHTISYDDQKNKIQFTSGHGAQGVGIHLTEGNGTPLNENDIIFRLNVVTGNIGIQQPKIEDGKFVSFARYPCLINGSVIDGWNQPITEGATDEFNFKLYAINKGSIRIDLECNYVVD